MSEPEAKLDSRSLDLEFAPALLILSRRQAAVDRTFYKALDL
jgi:hypothetical protein